MAWMSRNFLVTPAELGKMEPLQWYYYDGTYVEPHQGGQLNKAFVIMSVNVK